MKFFGYFRSSSSYRCRIAFNLKGIEPDEAYVYLRKGEQRSPDYGRMKHVFRTAFDRNLQDQMNAEKNALLTCAGTEGFTEGVAAFIEKREPAFRWRYKDICEIGRAHV